MIVDILPAQVLQTVRSHASGRAVWLVGGAPRDYLLQRGTDDFDFAVDRDALGLARAVADDLGGDYYTLDEERETGRVLPKADDTAWQRLDFAALRGESLEIDLRARDFTVNALALALDSAEPELIDPTGGLQDLRDRRLRLSAADALDRDPLRALRAVRLASELDFKLDSSLVNAVASARSSLAAVSVERLRDELFRMLQVRRPIRPLRVAQQLRLLEPVLPEVAGRLGLSDNPGPFELVSQLQTLLSVIVGGHDAEAAADLTLGQASLRLGRFRDQLHAELGQELSAGRARRTLLVLAALHAAPPDEVEPGELPRRARTLRLSGAEVSHLGRIADWLANRQLWLPREPDGRSLYRFYRALGPAGVEVVLLALSRTLSASAGPPEQQQWEREVERARAVLEPYFEQDRSILDPEPLLRGDELIEALGLEPGPKVGDLLERIREAQAAGEVSSREQALAAARVVIADGGLDQG